MAAAFFLVLAAVPSAALAQGDPWAGNPWAPNGNPWGPQQQQQQGQPQGDGDHDHGDRPIYAGDFVLIRDGDGLLLVDGKTGCVWRRSPPPFQFAPPSWNFEFPTGENFECEKRLQKARTEALKEGAN